MNDRGAGGMRGFQRSQSQNDLDRQTRDDDDRTSKDLRSSASGYNLQQRDASDHPLRRHPSDLADRHRRSYGDWNADRVPPGGTADISWTDALVLRQQQRADQKLRSPSDPPRNFSDTSRDRGGEYPRDYDDGRRDRGEHHRDDRRLHGAGDEFRRSRENMAADVSALNKKPSVRAENPKNQDIMNWLQLGNGSEPEPRMIDSNPDVSDVNRGGSNFTHSTTVDQPGSRTAGFGPSHVAQLPSPRSYPATRNGADVTGGWMDRQSSSPRADRSDSGFPQFGVANPTYDASQHASVSDPHCLKLCLTVRNFLLLLFTNICYILLYFI